MRSNGRCIFSIISSFDCFIVIPQQQIKCMLRENGTHTHTHRVWATGLDCCFLPENEGKKLFRAPIILPSLCLLHDCILQTFLFPTSFEWILLSFIFILYRVKGIVILFSEHFLFFICPIASRSSSHIFILLMCAFVVCPFSLSPFLGFCFFGCKLRLGAPHLFLPAILMLVFQFGSTLCSVVS